MDFLAIIQILDSTLRLATPLLFACLAGLFSERAGIFDIGLEGKMLASAFLSAAVASYTGNVWVGLLAGIGASLMLAAIHGVASITFRGNQLISGVALNFLASGLTVVVGEAWFGLGGRTPQLSGGARFQNVTLPLADTVRDVPVLGPVYSDLLSGHSALVYIALACVPLTWWVLYRTRFGLRLRAVGENPAAVDTAGVSVVGLRFAAVMICGLLCGLAGAYLATTLSAGFVKEMSAGRGYIALAALIFAKWRPWYALGATLLFGLLEALGNRFQTASILQLAEVVIQIFGVAALIWLAIAAIHMIVTRGGLALLRTPGAFLGGIVGTALLILAIDMVLPSALDFRMPTQFMQALPYVLTVLILAGFVGKAIPPRAGGQPYVKER